MQPIFPNNLSLCRYKKQHLHGVFGFARSERHNVIATWGLEREAYVWNPYSQQPMAQLDGHGSSVMSVVFHDAADQVITASSVDKTVRIWCATTFTLTQVWGLGVGGFATVAVVPYHLQPCYRHPAGLVAPSHIPVIAQTE